MKAKATLGIFRVAGHEHADVQVADIALIEDEAFLRRIVSTTDRNTIEDQRIATVGSGEHCGSAADLEIPDAAELRRRLHLSEQREAIAAGHDLERHRKHAVGVIPAELEFGVLNIDAAVGTVGIADIAAVGNDAADQRARHAIRTDFTTHARGKRQRRLQVAVAEMESTNEVAARHLACLDFNAANTIMNRLDG